VYRSATVVANICVYASITETHPIALIVPAEPALKKLADTIGVEGHGIGDLVYDERIQQEVLKQLQAVGRKAQLAGIEIIVGVVLVDEEWTPQNVCLAPLSFLQLVLTENRIWSLRLRS
jgi:long-chain acyl-CoA synthetase